MAPSPDEDGKRMLSILLAIYQNGINETTDLDMDALYKGLLIPKEVLESVIGHPITGTTQDSLDILKLKDRIEKRWPDWTLTQEGKGLRICTDSQAIQVNQREHDRGIAALMKRERLNAAIEVNNLSEEEKEQHKLQVYRMSMFGQALRSTKQRLKRVDDIQLL